MLDLGTGGGELLSSLAPLPSLTVAAENHPPTVPLAAARLRAHGAHVVHVGPCFTSGPPGDDHPERRLPFGDASFDLVTASSAAFCPAEALRVLRRGGRLVACVGSTRPGDSASVPGFTVDAYRDRLRALHDTIERDGSVVTWGTTLFVRARRP